MFCLNKKLVEIQGCFFLTFLHIEEEGSFFLFNRKFTSIYTFLKNKNVHLNIISKTTHYYAKLMRFAEILEVKGYFHRT